MDMELGDVRSQLQPHLAARPPARDDLQKLKVSCSDKVSELRAGACVAGSIPSHRASFEFRLSLISRAAVGGKELWSWRHSCALVSSFEGWRRDPGLAD